MISTIYKPRLSFGKLRASRGKLPPAVRKDAALRRKLQPIAGARAVVRVDMLVARGARSWLAAHARGSRRIPVVLAAHLA